jgi:hypothetical protein
LAKEIKTQGERGRALAIAGIVGYSIAVFPGLGVGDQYPRVGLVPAGPSPRNVTHGF